MANFPSSLPSGATATSTDTLAASGHTARHNTDRAEVVAIATKVGVDGSAVNTTHDYKLSGVSAGDKAVSQSGSEVMANKTINSSSLNSPTITTPTMTTPVITGGGSWASPTISTPTITNPTITGGGSWTGSPTLTTPTIASFTNAQHNHSNAAGGGSLGAVTATSVTTNSIIGTDHITLAAGASKLVKTTVLRQDDTTNAYQSGNSVVLTGWGVLTPGAANGASETVTFGVTFTQRPIVLISAGGDAAALTSYGAGGVIVKDMVDAQAHTITSADFVALVRSRDATNWGAGNTVFYQWMAIGEI